MIGWAMVQVAHSVKPALSIATLILYIYIP